jgi:hypothetical protein
VAPLAVDPEVLDGAGSTVIGAGEGLGSVISTLTTALTGCNGMAGDDPAGAAFGNSYNSAAPKLLEAMSATRNGLCRLGDGVRMSAHNYSTAEAMSNISGHGQPLPAPHPTGSISAQSVPSAVGSGIGAPAGWGWVSKYIGMIWPSGDSGKLRSAAAAWISAGTGFEVSEITGAAGPIATIGAQEIPEGSAIAAAFADANRSAAAILQQCNTIGIQLNSMASRIDSVHAAILDLLSRICDPLTGIKEVWEFLTDQDEDEIKKIARDIRTIVDQFTAEVQALSHQIAAAVTEASTILSTMGRYAEKEWDQFLHHTEVGRALNQVGQFGKGLGKSVGGLIKDGWTYGPVRAQVDPQGSYQSWKELLHGMAPLVGLGDDHAPGVAQSWKDLGKNAVHWDEWKTNPAEAAGQSTFDLATLLIPGGGEAAAAAKGGRAAADAAEAASAASRAESAATRALEDAPKPHAPASSAPLPEPRPSNPPLDRPPPRDTPTAPGATKPESAPADAPTPHGPTDSKPPSAEHTPAEAAPAEHSPAPTDATSREPKQAPPGRPGEATDPAEPAGSSKQPTQYSPHEPIPPADRHIAHDPAPSHPGQTETTPTAHSAPSEATPRPIVHTGDPVPRAASAEAAMRAGSDFRPPIADARLGEAAVSGEPAAAAQAGSHELIERGGNPEGGSPNAGGHSGSPPTQEGVPNPDRPHGADDHDGHHNGEPPDPDGPDDPPPPLHRDEPLPTKELLDKYDGENDPNNPGRLFAPKTVHYMSPGELEESRLFARDGLLHRAVDGMPFDTQQAATHWSGQGRAMFVMDKHGNLYASVEQDVGRLHHSSFLSGKPVAGAGELEVRDGLPVLITRKSGHYLPTEEQLFQVRDMLSEQGIDVSRVIFGSGF